MAAQVTRAQVLAAQVLAGQVTRGRVLLAPEVGRSAVTPTPVTVALSPDFDLFLYRNDPATVYATQAYLRIKAATSTTSCVSLAHFDLSAIPATATITAASLKLTVYATDGQVPVTVHRILPANTGCNASATWNTKDGSNPWAGDAGSDGGADAGCSVSATDYAAAALGSFTVAAADALGTVHTVTLDPAGMQTLLAANHGLVLVTTAEITAYLCSQNHATAAYRPVLSVTYVDNGRVILIFADGTLSDLTQAAPRLAARSLPWVSFLMPGQVGNAGKMSESQIATLATMGGIPASHGYTHDNPTLMDDTDLATHLEDARSWLTARSYAGAAWYAPPLAVDERVRDATLTAGYTAVVPYALGDYAVLPAGYSYTWQDAQDAVGWATVQAAIQAVGAAEVLILQFHKIVTTVPVATETSTGRLVAILDEIDACGLDVVTLGDL